MAPHTVFPQSELLTSWKEIASYLGKGVRTVQRWEQQFGLPVRRPNRKAKGIVHATRQELDQWLAMQWSQRPEELDLTAVHRQTNRVPQVLANIEQSAQLRQVNRELLHDLRRMVQQMHAECLSLTQAMTPGPTRD
jgi:hypothetical protein